jgi:hypothetical protein
LEPNHLGSATVVRDETGRPLKLPLAGDGGSAYMSYDSNGEISKVRSFYDSGVTRTYVRPNTTQPWVYSEKLLHGLEISPSAIPGASIAVDAQAGSVTIQGSLGTQIMRSTGGSEFMRTAAQAAEAKPLEDAIMKAYKAASIAEEGGAAGVGAGIGAAPMIRPF